MARKFFYYGKDSEESGKVSREDFVKFVPSRMRRTLKRGLTEAQKIFMKKIKKAKETGRKKPLKTHCRDMVIVPEMVGLIIEVHNGKKFVPVHITFEHLGRYLGEFSLTRNNVKHSAPGIGATKGTASASVK